MIWLTLVLALLGWPMQQEQPTTGMCHSRGAGPCTEKSPCCYLASDGCNTCRDNGQTTSCTLAMCMKAVEAIPTTPQPQEQPLTIYYVTSPELGWQKAIKVRASDRIWAEVQAFSPTVWTEAEWDECRKHHVCDSVLIDDRTQPHTRQSIAPPEPFDVPAVQEPSKEPPDSQYSNGDLWCESHNMLTLCLHKPPKVWTCADKSRVMLRSGDGVRHCYKFAGFADEKEAR